jgi:cysteine-rich repeat protein
MKRWHRTHPQPFAWTLGFALLLPVLPACGDSDPSGNGNDNTNGNLNQNQNQNENQARCGDGILDADEDCDGSELGGATCQSLGHHGGTLSCGADCQFDETGCTAAPACGDGQLDPGEACDDGNTVSGDGCSADCQSDESCGNAYVDNGAGEQCDDGNVDAGDGCGPTCLIEVCGNGYLDPDEVCDDGNTASGDGCSADCLSDESCGNGYVDTAASEQCDDGNLDPGDGCSPGCLDEVCGNHVVDPDEVCDDGNTASGDGCSADCQSDESCGNGYVDTATSEQCDDGNLDPGDGCSPSCLSEACGNNVVDPGEACDDGNHLGGDGCSADCLSAEVCGNGYVDTAASEQCDDGANLGGDGCSATCQLEICGNHVVDVGEACDDGNTVSGDGCSADCQSLESCGNGVVDTAAGEQCDDGGTAPGDGCGPSCQLEICGNGITDPGEVCDDDNTVSGDGCSADCQSNETCGNSVVDGAVGEQCDDGNDAPGDGCGATCRLEVCGNNIVDPGEQCDDGNTTGGDGCSSDCQSDETCGNGVTDTALGEDCDDGNLVGCDGCSPSCATEQCGNNVVDCGEGCDDGNLDAGDGCSPVCQSEACGNNVLDPGEECDDGNLTDADGCSALCTEEPCYLATDLTGASFPVTRSGTFDSENAAGGSCDTTPNNMVFFTYTAPSTGWFRIDATNHSTTDPYTRIAVFESTVCDPRGAELACVRRNDDHGSAWVELTAGQSYLVAFYTDGESYTMVDPEISITAVSAGAGDLCANAVDLSSVSFPYTLTGTFDWSAEPGGSCDSSPDHQVFFSYTPSTTGWYDIQLTNQSAAGGGTRLALFEGTGCDPRGPELTCETSTDTSASTRAYLTAGQDYLILFHTGASYDPMEDPRIDISPYTPGVGETCATAADVTGVAFPYTLTGTFDADVEAGGSCDTSPNNMVFFTYTPPSTGWYQLDLENQSSTLAYSRLAVFEGAACAPYGPELTCVTESSKTPAANLQLTGGQAYLIVFYTDGESYTMVDPILNIGPGTPPPEGAECATAVTTTSANWYAGGSGEDCWSWSAVTTDSESSHAFSCDSVTGGDVVVEYTTGPSQTTLDFDAAIANYESSGYIAFEITESPCQSGASRHCASSSGGGDTEVGSVAVDPDTTYYIWIGDGFSDHHLPDVDVCLW